jgi:itaconate CoA-transferase
MTDHPHRGPLAGTLVVGLEHSVAAPLATRILADLGARVIKVEPPRGDFARHWDSNAAGESAQFWWLNRHKESVQLDLKNKDDRAVFDSMLSTADVLVHNLSPPAAARLGLSSDTFDERYPHLVNCQISGYGAETPFASRKAYDMLIQAEAGLMSLTGRDDQPTRVGVSVCDITTGIYGALMALAGLAEKRQTGRGRRIDLSMFDVALELVAPMLVTYLNTGLLYPRLPDRHHAIAPYGVFACADGRGIAIAVEQDAEWARFCEHVLGKAEWAGDPRYATNLMRVDHREEIDNHIASFFSRLAYKDAAERLGGCDLAYAAVNDMADLSTHPVIDDRDVIDEAINGSGAPVQSLVGLGERLFNGPRSGRDRPPKLGEDSDQIRDEFSVARALVSQPDD